jgi:hypothetical protein
VWEGGRGASPSTSAKHPVEARGQSVAVDTPHEIRSERTDAARRRQLTYSKRSNQFDMRVRWSRKSQMSCIRVQSVITQGGGTRTQLQRCEWGRQEGKEAFFQMISVCLRQVCPSRG